MSTSDPIADMLTRMRNGIMVGHIAMMVLILKKAQIILVQIIMLGGQTYTIGRAIQLRQIPAACILSVYALPQ